MDGDRSTGGQPPDPERIRLWRDGLPAAREAADALCTGDISPIERWARTSDYPHPTLAWGADIPAAIAGNAAMARSDERRVGDGGSASFDQNLHGVMRKPPIRLVDLLAWYDGLPRGDGGLPMKGHIQPETLWPFLGHLVLLEAVDDDTDFRYRLYGSEVAKIARMDPTGRNLSSIAPRTPTFFVYRVTYAAALRRAEPLFCDHHTQPYLAAERWQRLILPFAAPEAPSTVRYLLVGKIPVGFKVEATADPTFVDW